MHVHQEASGTPGLSCGYSTSSLVRKQTQHVPGQTQLCVNKTLLTKACSGRLTPNGDPEGREEAIRQMGT